MAFDIKTLPDMILKRPFYQRVLVLVVLNAIIGGVVYSSLLSPQFLRVTDLDVQLGDLTKKLEENRIIARDIPKFRKEKAELEEKLKLALAQLPNRKEIPSLIDSISSAGKEVGLDILLFKPEFERSKGFYAEVPVTMEVSGGYESLYHFCERVAVLSRIVNIANINISLTGVGDASAPQLKATFVATTFRFIPTAK